MCSQSSLSASAPQSGQPEIDSLGGEVLFLADFNFPLTGVSSKLLNASLTPKKVFDHLDKRVVGQTEAKRILAIAYRKSL
jgi:hypothetical protein